MADQENKLSIIYPARDENLMTIIKEKIKPLENHGALSLWDYDFAIEDYDQAAKRDQAKRQLSESEQFIILWSIDLTGYISEKDGGSNPFQDYVKPFLQQKNAAAKDSIYSIIARPYDEKGLDVYSTVTIPKLKVPLNKYHTPGKVLESELSEIENAIYCRLLFKRFPNVSKDKFSEANFQRIAQYLNYDSIGFQLQDEMLKALITGNIDLLLALIKEKKLDKELEWMIEQEKQERQKQLERKSLQRVSLFLSTLEAKLLTLKGGDAEAERRYQQAHQLAPRNLGILEEWRDLLEKKGNFIKARQIDLKIDNATYLLEQDGINAHSNGNFFYNNKEFEKAEEWLAKALVIRRMLADKFSQKYRRECGYTLLQLGVLYYDLQLFSEANNYFQEARILRKAILDKRFQDDLGDERQAFLDYATTLYWLGQLYAHSQNPGKDIQQAISYYEEGIGIRKYELPQEDEVNIEEIIELLRSCSKLYHESGQPDMALKLEKEALEYKQKALQGDKEIQQLSKRVFISYSSKDKAVVEKIDEFLQASGIKTLVDAEDMRSGELIRSFISRSIRDTDFTLSVVSKNSLLSSWVTTETIEHIYKEAQLREEHFIPCYIDASFLEMDFPDKAWNTIEEEINEVQRRIDDRRSKDPPLPYDELWDRLNRLKDLKHQLVNIIQRLRNTGCTDLTEGHFQKGMEKIVKTMRES